MDKSPSPRELAEEARRALASAPMSPREHFEFLVQQGIIDRSGRVLIAKLFGDSDGQDTSAQEPAVPNLEANGT